MWACRLGLTSPIVYTCLIAIMQPDGGSSGASSGSLRHKLGSLLVTLGTRGAAPQRSDDHWRQDQAAILSRNALKEVGPAVPLPQRLRVLRELYDIVAAKRLEDFAVQALWLGVKDLLDSSQPAEARHAALGFLRALIAGQLDDLGVLRAHFFHVVRQHMILEDFQQCFDIVRTLTDSGRSIEYIEQDMGPYLAMWLPRVTIYSRPVDFLTVLVNVVKFNAPYLDKEVLIQLVHGSCVVAKSTKDLSVVELCLEFLNAVVCYSTLHAVSLQTVTATLCHTLNLTRTSHLNLDIMLKLLGTHLGHATINTLCSLLRDRQWWQNPLLLRGAVFYIGMSLWGVRRVETLRVAFVSVLPSIREVSGCEHTIVVYEIVLSLQRLIRKYAHSLHCAEWDVIYAILGNVQDHAIRVHDASPLVKELQDVMSTCAELHTDKYSAAIDANTFFTLVETGIDLHTLPMVLQLLHYRIRSVHVGEEGWIKRLAALMDRFYQEETVTEIRTAALTQLEEMVCDHGLPYEAELMDNVVLPLFAVVSDEEDSDVRCRVVQLLLKLLGQCGAQWVTSLLSYINSVLLKGLDVATLGKNDEVDKLLDCKIAVFGLTALLKSKLYSSSDLGGQVFHVLVSSLHQHYAEEAFLPATCVMRIKIFNCILSLRANDRSQVGYQDENGIRYSHFYVCQQQDIEGLVLLDYSKALSAVVHCLEREREWEVLVEVLLGLVPLLKNRLLALSASSYLSTICQLLCHKLENQSRSAQQMGDRDHDLSTYIYPVLTILCTCGAHLDRTAKHVLVYSLERGLVGQCAQLCLHALTLCLLEMQSTVTRLLPHILYRMGQVAATPSMAIPVLEFLSSIIPLPRLYNGFVEQQYLSVFAIALNYANTSKYNTYVVVMAHWVIALWFIRCRYQHRMAVARYITKSLSTLLSVSQEQASVRHRMGSFTHSSTPAASAAATPQTTKRRADTHIGVEMDYVYITSSSSSTSSELLTDLTELCIDMMARYTYSNISSQPMRSTGAELLVGGGLSKTWLLGNSLVTVTTSGPGGGAKGVCTRCMAIKRSLQPDHDNLLSSNEAYLPRKLSVGRQNEPQNDTAVEDGTIPLCSCWCRGWAEIMIRRPTGNVSWLMRVQNKLDILATSSTNLDLSLAALNMAEVEDETTEEEDQEEQEWGILTAELSSEEEGVVEEAQEEREEEPGHDQEKVTSSEQPLEDVDECSELLVPSESSTSTFTSPEQDQLTSRRRAVSGPMRRPTRRTPSSHSWSEGGMSSTPVAIGQLSYPSASLEALPPLFSYDEDDGFCRSPSLGAGVLSEPEQLNLLASVSQSALTPADHSLDMSSHSNSSEHGAATNADSTANANETNSTDVKILTVPQRPPPEVPAPVATVPQPLSEAERQEPQQQESHKKESPGLDESTPVPPAVVLTTPPRTHQKRAAPGSARSRQRVVFSQPSTEQQHNTTSDLADLTNNPSFIFLQLYHSSAFQSSSHEVPLLLHSSEAVERAVKVLDHMPPYDTHKIGVVYVSKGQDTEQKILANTHGSSRYQSFLGGLGQLLQLKKCQCSVLYLGGLDTSGTDGDLCCFWQDDITQVMFHVATLMPTHSSDPHCSNKKLHIGNDYVTIVYNDSGNQYQFGTIKGQFTYAEVQVEPLPGGTNKVLVVVKKGLEELVNCQPYFVSDQWLPLLVRQKALLVNLASVVVQSQSTPAQYLSNWLGRLRQIRHIKERCLSELKTTHRHSNEPGIIPDFTLFA